MECDDSRHCTASTNSSAVICDSPSFPSRTSAQRSNSNSCRYVMETSGNLKAALIIIERISGPAPSKASASSGGVDHRRDARPGASGRKASGPVGKNLWYAAVHGRGSPREVIRLAECWRVATMARAAVVHPEASNCDKVRAVEEETTHT